MIHIVDPVVLHMVESRRLDVEELLLMHDTRY